ncbi:sulfite exporter TauE/SafE family protein [Metabacillus litoralis]|uniref:sulfite exporter TauE/SafE family protein n=1 Tax=Metabacillus litoralis TaxID=152268 RepID=UPI001CFD9BCD|nr:sulfite exporter TauE/SafE family protein [Metabacillus litoralis]
MDYLLLLFGGLLAGTVGSLVGLGGGIIIVPLLLGLGTISSLPNISPQVAVGTSMIAVVFTGLSSVLFYFKNKQVDVKSGMIFFVTSGPGAILGAWLNKLIYTNLFSLYFGIFMILVSLLLMIRKKIIPLEHSKQSTIIRTVTAPNGGTFSYGFNLTLALSISFVVGVISGLFGIGGGSLLVPSMILLFSFPSQIAVATSMLIVFLSAILSSITHITLGNVNWVYVLMLIPGAWFGGKLGAIINNKLNDKIIISLLRIILIVIGLRMIF